MDITRHHIGSRMSQIVVHNDTVYLAGQVATDLSTAPDVASQTRQVLARIDELLAEAGSDKTKALMATIWLSDISTFDEMNGVWDAWVAEGATPARACIEARLARPDLLVEIRVVAAR